MISIRTYDESDAESVGRLIADTYAEFNLDFASPEEKAKLPILPWDTGGRRAFAMAGALKAPG